MKKSSLLVGFGLILAASVASDAAVLATLKSNAPAYPNAKRRVFEKPNFYTSKGDLVEIVRWGSPLAQVRSKSGRTGWIETSMLDTVNLPPVLSISSGSNRSPAVSPSDDSVIAKNWMKAQKSSATPIAQDSSASKAVPDSAKVAPEKPLDFPKDSAHITPRTQPDSIAK
ncbi:MAG: hypothetical protein H6686_08800 [Fibrobacteria bacterium]|nr:hypothetical protein [Fibrobacteria bacterium]